MNRGKSYADWYFFVNPNAGGGRGRRCWLDEYHVPLAAAFPGIRWAFTESVRDVGRQVSAAIRSGATTIVGVGGDGTHHHLVDALPRQRPDLRYCPLPLGSGNDWVRSLGVPHRLEAWIRMVRQGRTASVLTGLISSGGRETRFVNVAGFAFDALVTERVNAQSGKHRIDYLRHTLFGLRTFAPPRIRLTYDGTVVEDEFYTINVGCGRYSGGGMRLVPQADLHGDLFALTFARSMPKWKVLAHGWRFYTGTIGGLGEVTTTLAGSVEVEVLSGYAKGEADGEAVGTGRFLITPGPRLTVVSK